MVILQHLSRRHPFLVAAFGFLAMGMCLVPLSAAARCDDMLPPAGVSARPTRTITAGDLLRLRDVGPPSPAVFTGSTPLALSPDGTRAAFLINQADPASNSYCRALIAIKLQGPSNPRILDQGGEFILRRGAQDGLILDNGSPMLVTPIWSPDGRWIAYLRREKGITQIWRVRADGTEAGAVTRSGVDIEAFTWAPDSRSIAFSSTPHFLAVEAAVDREGLGGWLYDDRMMPTTAARPRLPASVPHEIFRLHPESGAVSPGGPAERALLDEQAAATGGGLPSAHASNGRKAWAERSSPSPLAPVRVLARDAGGVTAACTADSCNSGLTGIWWNAAGNAVFFLRREGWNQSRMGLYRWVPGQGAPRRIFATDDVLLGCLRAGEQLLCLRENSITPRRIVGIDIPSGRSHVVFDPNPEFASIRLGRVERLTWRNNLGLPAWGDLVLPPDYHPGRKLPMVVVQYRSSGFLRGGVGDEYPIQLFAARGLAVLSVEMPPFFTQGLPGLTTTDAIQVAQTKDWAERRSVLSSLETGVDLVIARGVADPARIGITGLSDGASSARFALLNTHLFAAASISTLSVEPRSVMTYFGPAVASAFAKWGYPASTSEDRSFWTPFSLTFNARTMRTPLLLQLADDEYLAALEAYTALRDYGQPVEMYVFPGEHHQKWQSAHRAALYDRNLDWFDFWLRGYEDSDLRKASQYRRWERMRDRPAAPLSFESKSPQSVASEH